ncbi:tyrosine-type recombinase/integrase [Streptomyces sp. NBC_00078]|uniref:tyrosine-type recombinase/integrase n=1 Tax=unclassified Streptomyces TaxID=2593676 RepID=UPI00224F2400|nr:tyrosine-type recombinase/integrase [Streptomyces sp. NBC_00078]MCX5424792.1 tyrosine-type recombinase/integrase [Streptomyces sp. NBC_00078]
MILPAPVLAALRSFKVLQAKEKLALGEAYAEAGYVLVHETGAAFTIKQLRRRVYRLMAILGLRRVRLYDARSSCLTYLANNGVPDHILARWAGHTNVKTTKKWYVKPDVEDLREAAQRGMACTVLRRRGKCESGGLPTERPAQRHVCQDRGGRGGRLLAVDR